MFTKTTLTKALCMSVGGLALASTTFAQETGTAGQRVVNETAETIEAVQSVINTPSDETQSAVQPHAPVSIQHEKATSIPANEQLEPHESAVPAVTEKILQDATGQINAQSDDVASPENEAIQAQQLAENKAKLQQLLAGQNVVFTTALAKLYGEHGFQPLWHNNQATQYLMRQFVPWVLSGVSNQAATQLAAISRSTDTMQRDILLSDAFLNYLNYAQNVRGAQRHWLYGNSSYKAALPSQSSISAWSQAISTNHVTSFVQSLEPSNKKYKAAVNRILASLPSGGIANVASVSETLKPGDRSSEVKDLATILKNKGFYSGNTNSDLYSGELVDAVKAFQARNGLSADGVVGANTRHRLNPATVSAGGNLYKLAINAQRLRVLPNEVNGIFVNIPTYQLNYYRNGQLVLNSKVIVGKKARPTPVMTSRLSNVVVNPPWNAPTRLINEDLIPKVRRDPSYIYRNGYTIVDSKGRTIDPYTIDWENMTAKKFPYRLRQAPGGDSALGSFKFNMPSSEAIYLHDTPSRGLFSRSDRALSSGCVRVHKADELATLLLNENGWTTARKQQVLASKKTTSANLSKRDDVYLYYVTMWVGNDGQIHTAPDIYNHDRKLGKTNVNWANIKKNLL